jgi:hypothetical protein
MDTADSNDNNRDHPSTGEGEPRSRSSPPSPFNDVPVPPPTTVVAPTTVEDPVDPRPTASGTGPVSEDPFPNTSGDNGDAVDIPELQRRLAAAEAETVRHVAIISSMHSWAAQTTTSLRQVQEKCETAESRAKVAEKEVETLRHQLTQVAAQVAAMAVAVGPMHATAAHGGENGGKKRRKKEPLPRVGTLTSVAGDVDAAAA